MEASRIPRGSNYLHPSRMHPAYAGIKVWVIREEKMEVFSFKLEATPRSRRGHEAVEEEFEVFSFKFEARSHA